MLIGSSAGSTLLSNKDFWDPKIQLFENDVERSPNKPSMNEKFIIFGDSTYKVEKSWMKIRENRIKRNKDFFRNSK